MAKMFYTIEEAAERLQVAEIQVKEMAGSGKLQQFRDGNKLMFKREQVESLAGEIAPDQEPIELDASAAPIPLADSSDTDQIDLMEPGADAGTDDAQSGTGISVFDTEEVHAADPMAQTQFSANSGTQDQELALESVSSGSGLLDLTRESDDTSLGAELLDEIYPGKERSDSDLEPLTSAGTGAFESAASLASGSAIGIGQEGLEPAGQAAAAAAGAAAEPFDPGGNGLSIGLLLAATGALVIAGIASISALLGVRSGLTAAMTPDNGTLWMYVGIIAGVSLVFGLVGMFLGKTLLR